MSEEFENFGIIWDWIVGIFCGIGQYFVRFGFGIIAIVLYKIFVLFGNFIFDFQFFFLSKRKYNRFQYLKKMNFFRGFNERLNGWTWTNGNNI